MCVSCGLPKPCSPCAAREKWGNFAASSEEPQIHCLSLINIFVLRSSDIYIFFLVKSSS
ncbi:hypothetical protein SLEP1_g52313 [Rubroshorea leprosula]|uniref:Uncharacterized protein n=1 Tax=Rubroshorea leprosula TaxID=152421 RepID=A0AAV5M869_9ROSI|nr:hypothetical protein SLEP1_g52313 [Rubroshorea leprosula]